MMARRVFLGILPLWVLAAVLAVTWLPGTFSTWEKAVRLALCAPLILYLPGRMLVDTLRIEGDTVTRGTLSVFLSFAACIFWAFCCMSPGISMREAGSTRSA